MLFVSCISCNAEKVYSPIPLSTEHAVIPANTPALETEVSSIDTPNWWYAEDLRILVIENDTGMAEWGEFIFGDDQEAVQQITQNMVRALLKPGVTYITSEAFYECFLLEEISLPSGLREIQDNVFFDCMNLKWVLLPDSIQHLDGQVFVGCDSLTELVLPPNITSLMPSVVIGCSGLKEIRIPSAIIFMDWHPIRSTGIQRIIFEGTVERIAFWDMRDLPDLDALVFLDGPPLSAEPREGALGLRFNGEHPITIYYLNVNKALWSPNGEIEWMGQPLVAIDSLDDLPPSN